VDRLDVVISRCSDPQDRTVRVYAITEGGSPQPLRELELGGPVAACHALETPQGRMVAWSGWWPRGKLLNLRTGEEKETDESDRDGQRVISMRVLASYHSLGDGEGEAEGEARLVAGRFDGKVGIFDVRSGGCLRVLGDTDTPVTWVSEVLSLAVYYTNDGAPRVVSAGSGSRLASIWDPEDGRRLHQWEAAGASNVHIRVFGEGRASGDEGHVAQLVSCSQQENELRVWAVGGCGRAWGVQSVGYCAWRVTVRRLMRCRWGPTIAPRCCGP
jgi:WD40 repeat protein